MDFIVANFWFENCERLENVYFDGVCTQIRENALKVRKSADFRYFKEFAENLSDVDSMSTVHNEDFYFIADYEVGHETIIMQTDIVGYEAAFIWRQGNLFAFSDDILYLCKVIKSQGYEIELEESRVREFLCYTENFFSDTLFTNINRMPPASIIEINVKDGTCNSECYNNFKMSGAYESIEKSAESLYEKLDAYFETHYVPDKIYAIGMSGGLDSRVAAYFAKKNNYNIAPIFIGVKRNRFGLLTNDAKRGEEINKYLELPKIKYFDPRKISLRSKVAYDALHAPNMVDNISQNMGKLPGFDVLIHAMQGGEAFGQLVCKDMLLYDDYQLAEYMVNLLTNKPKYNTASKTLRRIVHYLKLENVLKNQILCKPEVIEELISNQQEKQVISRVVKWIKEQRLLGLDNINIWHKFFYYRFAVITKTGYYSTLNNTVPSLATYMNPVVISEMLKWKSTWLIGKPIQDCFIGMQGQLSKFRSQTIDASINKKNKNNYVRKLIYTIERAIRGGAMVYTDWFAKGELKQYIEQYVKKTNIGLKICLKNDAWYYSGTAILSLMKIAYIEEEINGNNKGVLKNE